MELNPRMKERLKNDGIKGGSMIFRSLMYKERMEKGRLI
jgi:hypothetical protein